MGAAALHLALSLSINLAGRFNLLPGLFDESGISSALAFDSFFYRIKATELVAILARGHVADWLGAPLPFHVKLYSLSFTALSPLFGFTMLSVEPLNILYYLLIVVLVFKIGEEVFDERTALLAAAIVALWPSFLLHTTQLLRDPLFILMTLSLVLVITRWLTREHTLRRAILEALGGAAASAIVWLTRYNAWKLIVGFVLLGVLLLIVRQLRERRWLAGNIAGAALLLIVMVNVPFVLGKFLLPDAFTSQPPTAEDLARYSLPPCLDETRAATVKTESGAWSRLRARADAWVASLGEFRRSFTKFYADAGSNIDVCVRMNTVGDLVRYLPRGAANGFFAPYPNMWLRSGSTVGLSGRLLSGIEMLALYLIELLAILCLWTGRRRLPVWLIFLVACFGIIAHGLVVVNVAVLFRMRYVFWMLLIILGARGAMRFFASPGLQRSGAGEQV
jgi:4-amino-4-deoxy-L-arabinose transferase-like glycosyltransferase